MPNMPKAGDMTSDIPHSPLAAAVTLLGGVSAASRKLNVSRQTLYVWLRKGRMVSDQEWTWAQALARATGVPVSALLSGVVETKK